MCVSISKCRSKRFPLPTSFIHSQFVNSSKAQTSTHQTVFHLTNLTTWNKSWPRNVSSKAQQQCHPPCQLIWTADRSAPQLVHHDRLKTWWSSIKQFYNPILSFSIVIPIWQCWTRNQSHFCGSSTTYKRAPSRLHSRPSWPSCQKWRRISTPQSAWSRHCCRALDCRIGLMGRQLCAVHRFDTFHRASGAGYTHALSGLIRRRRWQWRWQSRDTWLGRFWCHRYWLSRNCPNS